MAWTAALRWRGAKEYRSAPEVPLEYSRPSNSFTHAGIRQVVLKNQEMDAHFEQKYRQSLIGTVKSARNLTVIKIVGAGHFLPMDRPSAALEMVRRWLAGEWWEDKEEK